MKQILWAHFRVLKFVKRYVLFPTRRTDKFGGDGDKFWVRSTRVALDSVWFRARKIWDWREWGIAKPCDLGANRESKNMVSGKSILTSKRVYWRPSCYWRRDVRSHYTPALKLFVSSKSLGGYVYGNRRSSGTTELLIFGVVGRIRWPVNLTRKNFDANKFFGVKS